MAVNLLVLLDAALLAVVDVPHLLDAVVVETSRLARMIAVTVTTTVETETAPTDPAAQTIGTAMSRKSVTVIAMRAETTAPTAKTGKSLWNHHHLRHMTSLILQNREVVLSSFFGALTFLAVHKKYMSFWVADNFLFSP